MAIADWFLKISNHLFCRFRLLCILKFSKNKQLKTIVHKLYYSGYDFLKFIDIIQYRPHNWEIFLQAIIHRSYIPFIGRCYTSNERLEFLGDSVLSLVVAEHLYNVYPDLEEGELTKIRSRLVNKKILSQKFRELNLQKYLLLSVSASHSVDQGSEAIVADAFESIVGAIYLDGGLKNARKFIHKQLLQNIKSSITAINDENYKSALLEYAQAKSLSIPKYSVKSQEGPEHDRRFTIEVLIGPKSLGVGCGKSKKEAEQKAAQSALYNIRNSNISITTE